MSFIINKNMEKEFLGFNSTKYTTISYLCKQFEFDSKKNALNKQYSLLKNVFKNRTNADF